MCDALQEEKQRALLHLQWKVMDENQQDDQEVNSKKVLISNLTRNITISGLIYSVA